MKHRFSFVLILLAAFFFCFPLGNGRASEPDELVLAIHPYLSAIELHKRFTPLAHYLEEKTGKAIRIEIADNYADHIKKVGEERADIAFMGPASYVSMTETYGGKIMLARLEINGSPSFHGIIIVRNDSQLASLADLAGKKIAFTDPDSTMGYLVPMHMIKEAGVNLDKLATAGFLGSHNNVAMAVVGGYFDAGAVKEEVFASFQERGIRMLAKSPAIPEHLFVASPKLFLPLVEILRESLLGLKDAPGGQAILQSIKGSTTALVPVKDSDFDLLRRVLSPAAE